jgi:hypothetical protein
VPSKNYPSGCGLIFLARAHPIKKQSLYRLADEIALLCRIFYSIIIKLHSFWSDKMVNHPINVSKSNDEDLVPPERYNRRKKGKALPPKFDHLSLENAKFKPIQLEDRPGKPNLPDSFFSSENIDELELFRLFFDDSLIERLVQCTNLHATHSRQKHQQEYPNISQRDWRLVSKEEILVYIGILGYMGIFPCPTQEGYWNTEFGPPIYPPIYQSMAMSRWQQIHRYFHVFDPDTDTPSKPEKSAKSHLIKVKPHEKVLPIADYLRTKFRVYWIPSTHLSIDEIIQGFGGRSADIVNIPSKPVLIGYKIWGLGDRGFIIDFLFHVPGSKQHDGPQQMDYNLYKEMSLSKTHALVIALMTRMRDRERGHCCWIDSLFTTERLLLALRDRAIAAAGTCRTTKCKTKREIHELEVLELPGHVFTKAIEELEEDQVIYEDSDDEDETEALIPDSQVTLI